MLKIDDYYIGVIRASFDYYKDPKNIRLLNGVSYDPFQDTSILDSLTFGVTTLLKKVDNIYYDQHNSRWENELSYELRKTNKLGISLEYVKPFSECYHEKPTTYIQEELENDYKLSEYILKHHSYIISHSKLYNKDVIMILQEAPMDSTLFEYLRDTLGEEHFEKIYVKNFSDRY